MIKTDHAKIRQQQRHITNDDIDFLFKYGVQVRQPHDCAIVHLSKKGKKIAKELDIKPTICGVVSLSDNVLLPSNIDIKELRISKLI